MPSDCAVILSRGGLPGLVGAALTLQEIPTRRLIFLHFDHPRRDNAPGLAHLERQARHLGGVCLLKGRLAQVGPAGGLGPRGEALPMEQSMLLTAALSAAVTTGASRVIWPRQCGDRFDAVAAATEAMTLVAHLAELENTDVPAIDAPLLELDDLQFMELGMQLGVPWHLAWSCDLEGPAICRVCPGCRRRQQLFAEARLPDPAAEPQRRRA